MTNAKRFSRSDWLEAGLAAIRQHGLEGLYIGGLTRRLGKTTGGFYAHFSSTEAYVLALAEHWRDRVTSALSGGRAAAAAGEPPIGFDHRALAMEARIEQCLRRLAATNPEVAEVCRSIDECRIDYLAGAHALRGCPPAAVARELARFEYAALIGLQQVDAGVTGDEAVRLHDLFLAMGRALPTLALAPAHR